MQRPSLWELSARVYCLVTKTAKPSRQARPSGKRWCLASVASVGALAAWLLVRPRLGLHFAMFCVAGMARVAPTLSSQHKRAERCKQHITKVTSQGCSATVEVKDFESRTNHPEPPQA